MAMIRTHLQSSSRPANAMQPQCTVAINKTAAIHLIPVTQKFILILQLYPWEVVWYQIMRLLNVFSGSQESVVGSRLSPIHKHSRETVLCV
jgi:hypothetical protein